MGYSSSIAFAVITVAIFALVSGATAAATEGGSRVGGSVLRSEKEVELLFAGWKVRHGKSYYGGSVEERKRYEIFRDNLRIIDEHNRPENNHTFTLGLNFFADLTNEEYQSMYLSRWEREPAPLTSGDESSLDLDELARVPESINWKERGAVGPVKNQNPCGSCWIFAAVAAVESMNAIAKNKSVIPLSEQEIMDCGPNTTPCKGDYVESALNYIQNHGISSAARYPYTARRGKCRQNMPKVATIDGALRIPSYDERIMKTYVARHPITVGIDANNTAIQFYKRGIITRNCGNDINHSVTIVGYGRQGSVDYWLVKNSWGSNWGEKGYMKIQRNVADPRGMCGIAMWPECPWKRRSPLVESIWNTTDGSFNN